VIRIAQLSDIHFGGEDAVATEAAVSYVHEHRPDLVIVTGDVTLNGLPVEFASAAAWIERLPEPRIVTPGNHDTPYWNLLLRAVSPFGRYRRYIGEPFGGEFDGDGFMVRLINTARGAQPRPNWSKGAVALKRAHAVADAFGAGPSDALKVVGCHHPLIEATGAPVTGGVRRGDVAAAILSEGGADLILTGHVHNPFAVPLPVGDNRTYAVGAGTLSLRTRGTPPSFNCITADRETITVTALGWTGGRFEPYRTWSLNRRTAG
jgi:3',5'-cyclic AMP phosphodiesterase CpdA